MFKTQRTRKSASFLLRQLSARHDDTPEGFCFRFRILYKGDEDERHETDDAEDDKEAGLAGE